MNQSQVVQELFKKHFGNPYVVGIEIGTKCADLTLAILSIFDNCFLYTIDPWEHRDKAEFEAGEPQEYHDKNKEAAMKRLSKYIEEDSIVILPMKSEEALSHIWHMQVDFVWIDGDHSAEGIIKDINLYYPLIRRGGVIGGHDFGQCHPLTEIITERFNSKINTGADFTWWVFK